MKPWHYFLSLDPTGERLEHALKVTLIFSIAAIIALIWRRPGAMWMVIIATLISDVSLGLSGLKKHLVVILSGISISLLFLCLTDLSQFKALALIALFITTFFGIGFIIFGQKYFAVGLYLAIFAAVALVGNSNDADAINRFFNALAGTVIAYLVYFYFPLDLTILTARSNIRKTFHDLANLFDAYALADDQAYADLRMKTWHTFNVISRLAAGAKVSQQRIKLTLEYSECSWQLRRLLVLLFQLKPSYPMVTPQIAAYCHAISSQLRLLTLPYKQSAMQLPEVPENLPLLINKTISQIETSYKNLHVILAAGRAK